MSTSRTTSLTRRSLLSVPALVVAAAAVIARPVQANASTKAAPECLADLIGAS